MRVKALTVSLNAALLCISPAHSCAHGRHVSVPTDLTEGTVRPTFASNQARDVAPRQLTDRTAIYNVTIFDGSALTKLSNVLIVGKTIATITGQGQPFDDIGAEQVDGQGGVLLPGLIDGHAHPNNLADLEALSSYGVTTVLGMACSVESYCNSLRNQPGLTDFLSAGVAATSPGSTHAIVTGNLPQDLISRPDQAQQFVENRIGNGSNYIKLVAEANGMNQAEHNALVAAGKSHGMLVTTHATSLCAWNQAITSGTNVIQHSIEDTVIPQSMLNAMLKMKTVNTPTLYITRILTSSGLDSTNSTYSNAIDSVSAIHKAGIPILAGTDCVDQLAPAFGEALHEELENLVAAGLSNVEVLRAATSNIASAFSLTDRGAVKVGKRADLLLVSGNPVKEISNTRNIRRVWIAGVEHQPVAVSNPPAKAAV